MRLSLLFLIGCASTPVPVNRVIIGGELQARSAAQPEEVAACVPSRHVVVVDPAGMPIEDARVDVEERVAEYASEETLAVWRYRAVSARTDQRGIAMICDPAKLSVSPHGSMAMEGIAGGSTQRDGEITVVARGQHVVVRPPFGKEVRVVVGK